MTVEPPVTHLTVENDVRREDVKFLENSLNKFNARTTGISDIKVLALFARAPDGSPVAGVFGWTWGGTCHIRLLFVSEDMRGQGQGTMLMRAAEKEAKSRQCHQIVVETHDFQAPAFYEKLGFNVVGRVGDYPRGSQFLTLVKHLV